MRTDLWGRSDVPGLYATGEVACSGVHGANRLASNSLLEGLVFSRRIADVLPGELREWADPAADPRTAGLVPGSLRRELQETMTAEVGVLRTATGLADAIAALDKLAGVAAEVVDLESWETTNLVTISTALADAAALREETRGSHWREDFPERDDERFAGHFDVVMRDGETELVFVPSPATDTPVSLGASTTSWPRPASTRARCRPRSTGRSPRTCRPRTSPASPPSPPTRAARACSRPARPAPSPGSASRPWSSRPSWATPSRSPTGSPTAPGSRPATS